MYFNDLESHYYWYRWLYSQRDLNLLFNEFPGIKEKKPCKSESHFHSSQWSLNEKTKQNKRKKNGVPEELYGRMHDANKINWIGIEDPEPLNYNKST